MTIAQGANETRPRFTEMPASAIAAGFVDLELPVETIPERILAYVRNWTAFDPKRPVDVLAEIHSLLRARTGHDFSGYKDRTFQRRLQRRMQVVQTTSLASYAERLRGEPDETSALFRDLLIGVTHFFRDPDAFHALESAVIPELFEDKSADDAVRVWVTGCSTGEEAYSIAMLLREHMDKLQAPPKVQIFASDIDDAALGVARSARYPANSVKEVSPERLKRFLVQDGDSYRLQKELREICVFSTHSVIRDPPFSRLDLISCRNLMIYLKPALQGQIIPLFHYALRPSGCLFLGISENVARFNDLFVVLDRKNRLFRRRDLGVRPLVPLRQFLPHARQDTAQSQASHGGLLQRSSLLQKAADSVVEHFAPVYVIVDELGQVSYFSAGTGRYLQAAAGPPTRDVVAMARPGLRADLRTALHQARQSGRPVRRDRISLQTDGGVRMMSLAVDPISEGGETAYGVVFMDRGPPSIHDGSGSSTKPAGEETAVRQIERELHETKERLQSTIEELETANEEFRSSNEELLSVNEELQSANEELETSKEELQSLNEELQTVNHELNSKIDELDRANSDLYNLFQSTQIATIFLDRNLVIRSFTPAVTKLFNLIPSDRGRPLTDIVSRIDFPGLEDAMRQVSAGGASDERAVSVMGGKDHFLARVLPYRSVNNQIDGVSLTLVNVTNLVAAEEYQKVLAAELSHRVKNTLAVVSSIVERTFPDGPSKGDLIGRLLALGHTHDVLSESGWTAAGLRELVSAELAPHGAGEGGNLEINGPQVMLKPQAALFLALAFHELATNAAKYGALSGPGGRVRVSWSITGDCPPHLELTWKEEGGPRTDGLGSPGFGMELIERGIRFELQGQAKLEIVDGGLACRIAIPADPQYLMVASPQERQLEDTAP